MSDQQSIVLFDGVCNFCDRSVQFIFERDPAGRFKFAPLQSQSARRLLDRCGLSADSLETLVLVREGRCLSKSSAALTIARGLTGPWPVLYGLIIVPRPIRDFFYDAFAKRRYRWFGKKEACMVPSPELRARFLE